MTTFFLDTSFVLGLEVTNDCNHVPARQYWEQLVRKRFSLITTSYVFDEIVTYLVSRGHHAKAVEVGNRLLSGRLHRCT
jgi:predicted nucleic acid-binding protein